MNRFLLKWLKLWDECVFKRSIPDSMLKSGEDRDDIITLDNGKPRRPSQKVTTIYFYLLMTKLQNYLKLTQIISCCTVFF